jgi:glyoxylase-like metal-dependent hydrolase (beta-lactamase superfamily II)
MIENVYRFRYEDVEGAVIRIGDDEELSLDEFLPVEHRLDGEPDYPFAYTCCYVHHRGRHVLIDAGFDPDTVPGALDALDVAPEEIELVLLTHADSDHVAGLLRNDGSFTYPNAQHVIGFALWDNLRKPETLEALAQFGEERQAFFRKLVRAFDNHLLLAKEEEAVADGIVYVPSPGHRVGHGIYELETTGASLLHTGDAFFHPVFAEHPEWPNTTDSLPDQAVESRKVLVARAADANALVLSTHIPFPGIGRIERADDGFRWMEGL